MSTDVDTEARAEVVILRQQVGELVEIVAMQGQRIDELQAEVKDQGVLVEIALKTAGMCCARLLRRLRLKPDRASRWSPLVIRRP